MTSRLRLRTVLTTALATATLLAAAACGGDSVEGGDSGSGSSDKETVTISGQDFTEMQILAALYQLVLENDGYPVVPKLVETRPIYIDQLSSGNVQVVPDYLSGIGDYLNTQENGEDAEPITTNDPEETWKAIQPLVEDVDITLLEPAAATDQNAYAVTEEFAAQNGDLKTLSDLGASGESITLAAAPDCQTRQDCAKGLKSVYGIDITKILPLGFGSPQGKEAAKNGEAQLVQVATTDGTLADDGFVLLEDDKGLQPAQNLVPAANTAWIQDNPGAEKLLNELSASLTTEDLARMNAQVDRDREKPQDVAQEFLEDAGLL